MFRSLSLAIAIFPVVAVAQDIKIRPNLTAEDAAIAFSAKAPDEGSPFFMEREQAKFALSKQAQEEAALSTVSTFPMSKQSPDSAATMFTKFFTDMFSSIKFKTIRRQDTTQDLTVDPLQFNLQDRREVNVTYMIRNNTGKLMRLDYPSTQRIEILTTDPEGKVVDRWSDDRAFEQREGVVFINPHERIQYSESLPTRDMKPGITYNVEGSVPSNPQFSASEKVTPQ